MRRRRRRQQVKAEEVREKVRETYGSVATGGDGGEATGCVAGAVLTGEYKRLVEEAGFSDVTVKVNPVALGDGDLKVGGSDLADSLASVNVEAIK